MDNPTRKHRGRFYDVPGGDTVLLDIVDDTNGYRQGTFDLPEDVRYDYFDQIKDVEIRDDDILICTYPKTGTNWLWEMLRMMVNKISAVTSGYKVAEMLEAVPPDTLKHLDSPRLLNSHIKVQYLPKEAVEKKIKTILLCRNPKDVAVSFYHFTRGVKDYEYGGKFENYLQMFMRGDVDCGSYPEYLQEWQQHIRNNPDVPFYIMYYEDLKQDCVGELGKLRDFLQLDVTDELLTEIADSCSINKMRTAKEEQTTPEERELTKDWFHPGFSLLRKGQIGDWRNMFTVAQSEMFDTWWEKESKGLEMFRFRYS